jgi:hypothetical protein
LGDLQKFSLSGGPVGDYKDVSLLEGTSAKVQVDLVNTITGAMGKRERKLAMYAIIDPTPYKISINGMTW